MTSFILKRAALAAAFFFLAALCAHAKEPRTQHVLYVTSDTPACQWSADIVTAFKDSLAEYDPDIQIDELKLSASEYDTTHSEVVDTLFTFINTRQYDLLVLAHTRLIDIFLKTPRATPGATPLLFTAYFGENPAAAHPELPITGIRIDPAIIVDNLRQGLVNQPGATNVFIVAADAVGPTRKAVDAFLATLPPERRPAVNLINRLDYTADQVVGTVKALPRNSFVVFGTAQPMPFTTRSVGYAAFRRINELQTAPIYAVSDRRTGIYTPGGIVVAGGTLGDQTARMARRILEGTPPRQIPVETALTTPVFDASVMHRLGFSLGKVPEGTRFVNTELPFHLRHRNLFTAICAALLSSILFTACLLFKRHRRLYRERCVFNTLPIRVCACDARGRIHYLIHTDHQNSRPRTIGELPNITNRFRETIRSVIETGKPVSFDYVTEGRHRRVDFMTLPPAVFGIPTVLFISVDIEAEFAARQEATNHAERFHFTLSAINDGVIAVNTQEIITLVNPAAARLLQKTEAQIVGKPLSHIFPLLDAATGIPVPSSAEKALRTATIIERNEPLIFLRPSGERLYISDSTAPICDHKGNVTGAVLVFRDVSGEQLRSARIREQNTFLEAGADLAGITYFKLEGQNPAAAIDARYWARDPSGAPLPPETWIIPEDLPAFLDAWNALRAGQPKIHIRYSSDHTGTRRHFEMTARLISEDTPGHPEWLGVIRDTTQARIEDQRHQDTLLLLQKILDHLPCHVFTKNIDQGFRYELCNALNATAFNRPVEEIIGKTDADLLPPEAAASVLADDQAAIASGRPLEYMHTFLTPQGKTLRGKVFKQLFTKANGERILLGMAIDMTQELQAQEEVRNVNALLQSLTDNLACYLWIKEYPSGRYVMANAYYRAAMNLTHTPIQGRTDDDFFTPEAAAEFRRSDAAAFHTPGGLTIPEEPIQTAAGTRSISTRKVHLKRQDGSDIILGMSYDITEQVNARTDLSRANDKLRSLTDTLSAYVDQERLINRFMESLVLNDDNSDAMLQILKLVGQRTGAANCFIFKYNYAEDVMRPHLEWVPEGIPPAIPGYPDLPLATEEAWYKAFKDGKPFIIDDLNQPRHRIESPSWFDILKQTNIASIYTVPLRSAGTLWGHLEIDFTHPRAFTVLDNHLIEAAAHITELIIERSVNHMILERSEKEKQLIIDTIPIPIILFNKEQKVILINHAAVSRSEFTEQQLLDQPCWVSFCGTKEGYPNGLGCPVGRVLKTGIGETYCYTEGGFDFSASATPIFDSITKELVYVVETAVDITDFNRTQQQLTQAMKEAQSADKAKSLFIATMSHELRTPLNAVIGFSELLQGGTLTLEEQKDCFKSINLAGSALLALINDVLDLSKIEADQIEIVTAPTNVNALLTEIEAIFRHRAEQKDIFISLDAPPSLPLLALDHLRFRQILLNLVGNAIKFTNIGGVTIRLRYQPETPGAPTGALTLAVTDSGPGIPPDQQERIFQPFIQETGATRGNRSHEGTGLGLTISTRLVHCMGGKIELQSKVGQGSTFTVTLPRVAVTQAEGFRQAPAPAAAPAPGGQFKIPAYPPKNILIVDDVALNLKVLTALLNRIGQKPLSADNATTALEIIRTTPLDLIITDIWMPKITGEELARAIRAIPEVKDIPIIAITADTEADTTFDMHLFNGRAFKPITIPSLIHVLGPYLDPAN